MTTADQPSEVDDRPLELDDEERELVQLELEAMIPGLSGPRRARFEALAEAVDTGRVPAELQPQLQSVVSLALQTARARQLYSAEGERILTRVYRRTPDGRELSDHLRAVNDALAVLAGSTLRQASVRMRTLGHFTVTLKTDAARVKLAVHPDSVDVESVAVGEGQRPKR